MMTSFFAISGTNIIVFTLTGRHLPAGQRLLIQKRLTFRSSMWRRRGLLLIFPLLFFITRVGAQKKDTARVKNKPLVAAVPLVFYTPETKLGLGAMGMALFNWKSDSLLARASSVNVGFAV